MDGVLTTSRVAPAALETLAGVARDGADDAVERALTAARELLGLELAYIAEAQDAQFRFHAVSGDAEPFGGPGPGARVPRTDTLCDRMLRGEIANVVPDVAGDPAARGAHNSPGVGAYVGVPVRLTDGTVFGSLCCVSSAPVSALDERDAALLEVLARIIAGQIERERAQREVARLEGAATAGQALLAALKARERYTAEHSEAVVDLASAVATELGLDDAQVVEAAQVALLHDVGKLGVPEAILQKPGPLSDAEWQVMRGHPAFGERVVASIPALAHLAPAVRAEHERWDGGGYPDGLVGEQIPLASRICLVCDAWHAMTSDRPYRAALPVAEARSELERGAGSQFCPRTVRALMTVLDAGLVRTPKPDAEPWATAPPERAEGQPEDELRALIAVAGAVAAAHRLEDVLEVVAEETCRVMAASSVSISRWEREQELLRTLINVGGPWDRFPADETYRLADYPLAARLLREGTAYVISRSDAELGEHDRALLDEFEIGSYIGVPVSYDGRVWGKLEVFADVGDAPFTQRHLPFLEAIAGQVGAAIGRAELFSHVSALAYTDALTGLANRRALEERIEAATAREAPLAIAFCDLDHLKAINDAGGHAAGDAAIRRAADALAAAARSPAGAFVGRMGGDEFCVVLEDGTVEQVAQIVSDAGRALRAHGLSISSGAAASRPGDRPADLFRAADAAQYRAKRGGRGRTELAGAPRAHRRDGAALAALVLAEARAERPDAERLERIARLIDAEQ